MFIIIINLIINSEEINLLSDINKCLFYQWFCVFKKIEENSNNKLIKCVVVLFKFFSLVYLEMIFQYYSYNYNYYNNINFICFCF